MSGLPNLQFHRPASKVFSDLNDVKGEKIDARPNEGVYITGCQGSEFSIETRCAKVGIEGCKNIRVDIKHSPLSAMMEITNCDGLHVYMDRDVLINTITVDLSSNVTLHVLDPVNQMYKVFWHKVSKVIVDRGEAGEFLLDKVEENNQAQIFQFICKVQPDGTFSKDPAIRVNGYPTTEEEHIKAQAVQAEYDRKMEELVFKSLNKVAEEYVAAHKK